MKFVTPMIMSLLCKTGIGDPSSSFMGATGGYHTPPAILPATVTAADLGGCSDRLKECQRALASAGQAATEGAFSSGKAASEGASEATVEGLENIDVTARRMSAADQRYCQEGDSVATCLAAGPLFAVAGDNVTESCITAKLGKNNGTVPSSNDPDYPIAGYIYGQNPIVEAKVDICKQQMDDLTKVEENIREEKKQRENARLATIAEGIAITAAGTANAAKETAIAGAKTANILAIAAQQSEAELQSSLQAALNTR
jgi:hypothetical protein